MGAILHTPCKSTLLITLGRGVMRHSALLFIEKGRRKLFSLPKVTFSCFVFILMSSDLPRVSVWGHFFVKRLCAGLDRGFQQWARGYLILQAVHVLSCLVRA